MNSQVYPQVEKDFEFEFSQIDRSQSKESVANSMVTLLNNARHTDIIMAYKLKDTILNYIIENKLELVQARYYSEIAEMARVRNRIDQMIDYYGMSISFYQGMQENYPDSMTYEICYALSGSYNNLADGYVVLGRYDEALQFYKSSLTSILPWNDSLQNSIRFYNISDVYVSLNQPDSAMKYIMLCKEMEDGLGTSDGLAYAHEGLASVYQLNGDFKQALKEINIAIAYTKQVEAPFFQLEIQTAKADLFYNWGLMDSAKNEFLSIEKKAKEIGYTMQLENCYLKLKNIYSNLKEYDKAFQYSDLLLQNKDSLVVQKAEEKALEFEIKYQMELKDSEIESLNKQNELTAEISKGILEKKKSEDRRTRTVTISLVGGLVLLTLIGLILLVNSKRKVKLNNALKKSHKELSEKHSVVRAQSNEIGDSIAYAKNIQAAILPNQTEFSNVAKDRFVLFSPKDIVSGDFYWTFKSERLNLNYLAVSDCTGHGVPGAFMSILGISLLDKIVIKLTDLSTSNILTELNNELHNNLSSGGINGVRDGMDIALISINEDENQIKFSGARNSVIHISNDVLTEYKGGRIDLGRNSDCNEIIEQTFQYKDGDMLYMFTDGYVDQKGGSKGKKFFMQPFRELLTEVSSLPVNEQKEILESKFGEWKGGQFEQMDDVLILGVRL